MFALLLKGVFFKEDDILQYLFSLNKSSNNFLAINLFNCYLLPKLRIELILTVEETGVCSEEHLYIQHHKYINNTIKVKHS